MYNEIMNNEYECSTCGIKQCKNSCECHKKTCGCKKSCCEMPKPVIDVQALPDDPLTLSFNFNGVGTSYDFRELVRKGETDTSISADAVARVLKYMAERHIDTISAKELGSILHLTDIADIDISGVDDNSMLVYKKESDCSRGCDNSTNKWVAHNALNHIVDSVQYLMGYDSDGAPKSLSSPSSPSQQYLLGWNGNGKAGWTQIKTAVSIPSNAYEIYFDGDAHEFVKVKVQ